MSRLFGNGLSRRERQIMNVIYERGQATAAEVCEAIPEPPGYSAVRALLRILEEKGHLRHVKDGARYVYLPIQPRQQAARSALSQVLNTFFAGSIEQAVAALITDSEANISDEELDRLASLIEQARETESKQ
jgi:predicted transcriptional regulator